MNTPEIEQKVISVLNNMTQDWELDSVETWTSPESSARYPLTWRLRIPGNNLDLLISPVLEDQENRSRLIPGLNYWEGSVGVKDSEGERVGRGFIELTGYGQGSRLPL